MKLCISILVVGLIASVAAAQTPSPAHPQPTKPRLTFSSNGFEDGGVIPKKFSADKLALLQAGGVDRIHVHGYAQDQTMEDLQNIKKRFAEVGLAVDSVNADIDDNTTDLVLNTPRRDNAVEAFRNWIRVLGDAMLDLRRINAAKGVYAC